MRFLISILLFFCVLPLKASTPCAPFCDAGCTGAAYVKLTQRFTKKTSEIITTCNLTDNSVNSLSRRIAQLSESLGDINFEDHSAWLDGLQSLTVIEANIEKQIVASNSFAETSLSTIQESINTTELTNGLSYNADELTAPYLINNTMVNWVDSGSARFQTEALFLTSSNQIDKDDRRFLLKELQLDSIRSSWAHDLVISEEELRNLSAVLAKRSSRSLDFEIINQAILTVLNDKVDGPNATLYQFARAGAYDTKFMQNVSNLNESALEKTKALIHQERLALLSRLRDLKRARLLLKISN